MRMKIIYYKILQSVLFAVKKAIISMFRCGRGRVVYVIYTRSLNLFFRFFRLNLVFKVNLFFVRKRKLVLGLLILIVLTSAFIITSQYKKTPVVYAHMLGMSIAISDMEYGLTEYRGYNKIGQMLVPFYRKYGYATDFSKINDAINKVLNVDDVTSEGIHLMSNDIGIVDWYRLGFRIFGYKAESTFYLYHSLFALSVLVFMITFYKRDELLYILLLFSCSYLVIVQTPELVIESLTLARFYPILTLLPAFYISLLILRKRNLDIITFIGSIIQTFILVFAVHGRSPGLCQLGFLISLTFILISFWFFIRRKKIKEILLRKIYIWPLAIVLVGFFLLKFHLAINLNDSYTDVTSKHPFWHSFYLGLGDHPDSQEVIGFSTYNNDRKGFELVKRMAPLKGLTFDIESAIYNYEWGVPPDNEKEIRFLDDQYESIVREECLRIFQKHPWFVISSYFYKIPLFFKVYFSSSGPVEKHLSSPGRYYTLGATMFIFNAYLLLIVFSGLLLVRRLFIKNLLKYCSILFLAFVFALIQALLGTPGSQIIVDSGLLFTIFIYIILSCPIFYLVNKPFRGKTVN
jgi:hypothetical protein